MEPLNDLEMCVNLVRQGDTNESRCVIVNKLLEGEVNPATQAGKDLMTRRALLMTELREKNVFPMKEAKDE